MRYTMDCTDCGGYNGWIIVDQANWDRNKNELSKCGICGAWSYCANCAPYGDLIVERHQYDNIPRPLPREGQRIINVRLSWCGS